MNLSSLPWISAISGKTLNVEEISALESGMVERKLEEKLTGVKSRPRELSIFFVGIK